MRVRRPVKRADCLPGGLNEARPCPHLWCPWHMWSEMGHGGSRKPAGSDGGRGPWYRSSTGGPIDPKRLPQRDPAHLESSCILDASEDLPGAGRGEGMTLEAVGDVLDLTRERVRQIEADAASSMRDMPAARRAMDLAKMLGSGHLDGAAGAIRRTDVLPPGGPVITLAENRRSSAAVARLSGTRPDLCRRPGCHRLRRPSFGRAVSDAWDGCCSRACAAALAQAAPAPAPMMAP